MEFASSSSGYKETGNRIVVVVLTTFIFYLITFFSINGFAAEISTFAGGDIDGHGQGFSYLGLDVTQRINKTFGISGRIQPNYLTYKYKSGDQEIKANAPGLFLVGGIKYFWNKSMIAIFGGGEFRDTDLSPDDLSSSVRGNTASFLLQGELDTWVTSRINLYAMASYSFKNEFVYEKAKLKKQISNLDFKKSQILYFGVEQFFGRNSDFQGEGVGLVLEMFHRIHLFSVAIKSGYKHDTNFGNGIYWGLELYKGF